MSPPRVVVNPKAADLGASNGNDADPRSPTRPARDRLFARLDELVAHRVVWCASPAGSGKTSLVEDWLMARRHHAVWFVAEPDDCDPATFLSRAAQTIEAGFGTTPEAQQAAAAAPNWHRFSRALFRSMASALRSADSAGLEILVLDGFEVLSGSPVPEILAAGIADLPAATRLVVLSHEPPHPAFARLEARGAVGVIGWSEMRLNHAEALAVAEAAGLADRELAQHVVEQADGWVAGLVLLAGRLRSVGAEAIEQAGAGVFSVFDRLASPMFAAATADIRSFLLRTCFLEPVTASMAASMTGRSDSAELLETLVERSHFISRLAGSVPTYRYHGMYRRFLLARARASMSDSEYRATATLAARTLEEGGHAGAAIECHARHGGEQDITRIVLKHADSLLARGRGEALLEWLRHLPPDKLLTNPRLRLCHAFAILERNPQASSAELRECAMLCEDSGDLEGAALACAGLIQSYAMTFGNPGAIDPWIDRLQRLAGADPDGFSRPLERRILAAAGLIILRKPANVLSRRLTERALRNQGAAADPESRLQLANLALVGLYWTGGSTAGQELLRAVDASLDWRVVSPVAAIQWRFSTCAYHHLAGDMDAVIADAKSGIALAQRHALHMHGAFLNFYAALAHLMRGELDQAESAVDRLTADMGRLHTRTDRYAWFVRAGIALARGDAAKACEFGRMATRDERQQTHPAFLHTFKLGLAIALLESGDAAASLAVCDEVLNFALAIPCPPLEWGGRLAAAEARFVLGRRDAAREQLANALRCAVRHAYEMPFPFWRPQAFANLMARAMEAGIEQDHVHKLIRRWRLEAPASSLDEWPWPVRVRALGHFEVVIDDKPLIFAGKTQRRPLELLKAMVAYGGTDVPEAALCDALWPDAEGNAAHKSLEIALHRLRKLLRHDHAIVVKGGKLSLRSQIVWVDIWSLERKFENAQQALAASQADDLALDAPFGLYRGQFLAGDDDIPWAAKARSRLRGRWRQYVHAFAARLRVQGRLADAIRMIERALQVEPADESLHCALIALCGEIGDRVAAERAYVRCREALAVETGEAPSRETAAALSAALSGKAV
jgi:LuxR family maltose regulon positive regulatory protein